MYPLGSRGNAIISIQACKSLISITGRGMSILNYHKISVSYHEKLMTLGMVSTPGMARVTRALSSAQLAVPKSEKRKVKTSSKVLHNHSSFHLRYIYSQLPIAAPHLKEKDALA